MRAAIPLWESGSRMRLPWLWVVLLSLRLAVGALGQEAPAPPPTPLALADEAARAYDYDQALKQLAKAAATAKPEELARIKQRQVLYERSLGMTSLVTFARDTAKDNPRSLVGFATTRGGKTLSGLIQLCDLGVTDKAGLGNRHLDRGALSLRLADGSERTVTGPEVAQLSVTWLTPEESKRTGQWVISKLRIVTQAGEVLEGTPTWVLFLSSLSVRPPGADDDTDRIVYPGLKDGGEDLVAELTLLGGPPLPPPPAPAGPPAAGSAPSAPPTAPPATPTKPAAPAPPAAQ